MILLTVDSRYRASGNFKIPSPKFGAISDHSEADSTPISFKEEEVDKYLSRAEKKELRNQGYLGHDYWVTSPQKDWLAEQLQDTQAVIDQYIKTKNEYDAYMADIQSRKEHIGTLKTQIPKEQKAIEAQQIEIKTSEEKSKQHKKYLSDHKKEFKRAMLSKYRALYQLVIKPQPKAGFRFSLETSRFTFTVSNQPSS